MLCADKLHGLYDAWFSRFASFPHPGDAKKRLLPELDDGGESKPSLDDLPAEEESKADNIDNKNYWMPDKLCKACYACETPFSIFWRRHHCRLCGQVFCSSCSNFFIDGRAIGSTGTARACRMCHEQVLKGYASPRVRIDSAEDAPFNPQNPADIPPGSSDAFDTARRTILNYKTNETHDEAQANLTRVRSTARPVYFDPRLVSKHGDVMVLHQDPVTEELEDNTRHLFVLQRRASTHIEDTVNHLLELAKDKGVVASQWAKIVCYLVREVVSTVDPNVRHGDSIDIRPYVKLKIIPGGAMEESVFVDGVVFRKNVAHKKMAQYVARPRILLLAGGIEFQRTDSKLSALDTLLEQEERYTQILVEKIMSLRPNVIMVGKAVSRKAQELLVSQNVVLLQHMKYELLERVARMTGATILSSTDHMISQHGDSALGRCNKLSLRKVVVSEVDDPEGQPINDVAIQACGMVHDDEFDYFAALHELKQRPRKPTTHTYAYLDGCPTEVGCTLVLRGAPKPVLKEIKKVIRYAVMVAYHLRLEVAFYNDRFAILPDSTSASRLVNYEADEPTTSESDSEDDLANAAEETEDLVLPESRLLLSSSLDVDVGAPYARELRGHGVKPRKLTAMVAPYDHQTLLVTSILMGATNTQKTSAEIKGIRFYANQQDLSLGQFLIDTCFQLSARSQPPSGHRRTMLDHTFSFVHRTGRIDITMHVLEGHSEPNIPSNPFATPITMWSYCKKCQRVVTPATTMSDETWKISFGKFLEIMFYNRTARGRVGDCSHIIRENHILFCAVDGLAVRFEFIPIHPYSLHIRKFFKIDEQFHLGETAKFIHHIAQISSQLFEDFHAQVAHLERLGRDLLSRRVEDLSVLQQALQQLTEEVAQTSQALGEQLARAVDKLPTANKDLQLLCDQPNHETPENAEQRELNRDSEISVGDEEFMRNPMVWRKQLYLRALSWNDRIEAIARVIEGVKQEAPVVTPGKSVPDVRLVDNIFQDEGISRMSSTTLDDDDTTKSVRSEDQRLTPRVLLTQAALELADNARAQDSSSAVLPEDHSAPISLVRSETSLDKSDASESVDSSQPSVRMPTAANSDVDGAQETSARVSIIRDDLSATGGLDDGERGSFSEEYKGSVGEDNLRPATSGQSKRVKIANALARLMGRENAEPDPKFRVPLGELSEGRPGLESGMGGLVVLVFEDQLTSVIAHTLASVEYNVLLKQMQDPHSVSTGHAHTASQPENKAFDLKPVALERAQTDVSVKSAEMEFGSSTGAEEIRTPTAAENSATLVTRLSNDIIEPPNTPLPLSESDGTALEPEDANRTVTRGLRATMLRGAQPIFIGTGGETNDVVVPDADQPEPTTVAEMGSPDTDDEYLERQLLSTHKSHIKYRFGDSDGRTPNPTKFICHVYWASQFAALRQAYLGDENDEGFIRSLASSARWNAQGGKSGATFSKTSDERFVVKQISRTELQMFLEFAPSYFEYMSKVLFHNLPTVLCKILGVFQLGYHNRATGKKVMEQVVVMENLFHKRKATRTFDLKGSSRGRYVEMLDAEMQDHDFDSVRAQLGEEDGEQERPAPIPARSQVLLDDNLTELTKGRPFPLKHRAKVYFHKAILNDTLFLSLVNIIDYSILVGFDENTSEVTAGIIDYMRQYDIIKKMERVGKSVGMIAGQAEPTVIQPPQYRKRFQAAMERYFMTVPDKWTNFSN